MALLSVDVKGSFPDFFAVAENLEAVQAQALGFIGTQAKRILKEKYLSGQMLKYDGWQDKLGRSKVTYRITKGAKAVVISSYPANFFTVANKRQKKIALWSGLRGHLAGNLQNIINTWDRKYLKAELNKFQTKTKSRDRF